MIKYIKSNKQKELLKIIGQGLLVSAALFAPNIIQISKLFPQKSTRQKYYIKQSLKNLVDEKIIILGGEIIKLSPKGEKLLKIIQFDEIELVSNNKWDKIWRLVSYDIPNKYNNERNYFRKKLKDFGFIQIQKSLWLVPIECKEEIAILAQTIGVSPFVIFMQTDYVPKQDTYLKYFELIDD